MQACRYQVAGVDGHRDRRGEIGVVQDDVGRLAPELQRQALHCVQGVLSDQFSDLRRTGESDFLNDRDFALIRPRRPRRGPSRLDDARGNRLHERRPSTLQFA